eukprot:GHVN01060463.1.p1 GENE.GHVN01060463.1~~GHVN01060463.1.p1  ORF type:complete len:572 (+),score=128.49 GHVN01060463.1:154-1716(+)
MSSLDYIYPCSVHLKALDSDGVPVQITSPDEAHKVSHTIKCKYVVGCDGGSSLVRKSLMSTDFVERSGARQFLAADVRVSWGIEFDRDLVQIVQSDNGVMVCIPMADNKWRIVVSRDSPDEATSLAPHTRLTPTPETEDLQKFVDSLVPGSHIIGRCFWSRAFSVGCRLSETFVKHRCVLVGDAAHVHPPVMGEGLNAGILDAYNLGWKLSAVVRGAPVGLLESYDTERRHAASEVMKMTSTAFEQFLRGGRAVRAAVCVAAPIASHLEWLRVRVSRSISQVEIHYPRSSIIGPRCMGINSLAPGHRVPDSVVVGAPLVGTSFSKETEYHLHDYLKGPHHTVLLLVKALPPGSKARTVFGCEMKQREAVRFNVDQAAKLARLGRLLVEGFGGREDEAVWGGVRIVWVLTGIEGKKKNSEGEGCLREQVPARLINFFSHGSKIRGPHHVLIDHKNEVITSLGVKFSDPESPHSPDQSGSGDKSSTGFAVIRPDGYLAFHGYTPDRLAWTAAADYALNWFTQ